MAEEYQVKVWAMGALMRNEKGGQSTMKKKSRRLGYFYCKNGLKWTFRLKKGNVSPRDGPRTVAAAICDGACSNLGPDI